MASFLFLDDRSKDILAEIFLKSKDAELLRQEEYHNAVVIQAWYRGCRSRQYLAELHEKATEIQRIWRGFAARKIWRKLISLEVERLKSAFYNGMATKIEKTWRGFFSRKTIHDFYALKRYLRGVEEKNQEMRLLAAEEREREDRRRLEEEEAMAHKRLMLDAKSKHHLISTSVIPGVFNNPYHPYPKEMEYKLRAITPLLATEKMREDNKKLKEIRKCEKKELKLPPLPAKPQGPFKAPKAVYIQRHKPLSPSLRVQSSYFSKNEAREKMMADEWVNRVHDDRFNQVGSLDDDYQPLLHTTTPFGQMAYGVNYFRESTREKWVVPKDFETLVPPIPVFDKFNQVYDDHCHHCSV